MMIFIFKCLLQSFRKKYGRRSTYTFRSQSIVLKNLKTNEDCAMTGTEAENPLSREILVGFVNDHKMDGQEEDITKMIT